MSKIVGFQVQIIVNRFSKDTNVLEGHLEAEWHKFTVQVGPLVAEFNFKMSPRGRHHRIPLGKNHSYLLSTL